MKIPLAMRITHYKYLLLQHCVKVRLWWARRKAAATQKRIEEIERILEQRK